MAKQRRELTDDELRDAERLRDAWERYKIATPSATQESVAFACGWKTQGAVSQYLRGVIPLNLDALLKFAGVFGVAPQSISPRLAHKIAGVPAGEVGQSDNVQPGPEIRGKVPLISWVQAGDFSEVVDLLHPGEAFEWIETTVQPRAHTFALRVHNDSMEPDFPAGTILIVEPELDAHAGDFIIAKNGDEEATFKQLVRDGGDWYLKPLNPRYPLKPLAGCQVVGVVRAAERRFR
ncbi:MAG: XRE family transcriptional regulator [Burkholderia sp.]